MAAPAKKAPPKTIVKHVAGLLESSGAWTEAWVYSDNSIRIVRHWCVLDPPKEWPVIEESDWFPHRFLVSMLEGKKPPKPPNYKHPLEKKK